ncbi:uncharacterized protein LOC121613530 [Chelmon rostratus]|uniref:uncharacterized protein LOC121613530 n=1 Tax=Chelmon rostratus TaxID=109905 RepID=UPI001BEAA810|nr:uncharacterized protein LOC121613530 [Chelmon rostratus]
MKVFCGASEQEEQVSPVCRHTWFLDGQREKNLRGVDRKRRGRLRSHLHLPENTLRAASHTADRQKHQRQTDMDKLANLIGDKVGDIVTEAAKDILGVGGKDEDEDDKKGGVLAFFGGNKKEEEEEKKKGGLFSFGDDKKKDDDKGGFFSNLLDTDDDKEKDKKSGFTGLFTEQGGPGAAGGDQGGTEGGQSVGVSDGDLFSDLMDVAEETSKGQ